jgi:hypothetical protein
MNFVQFHPVREEGVALNPAEVEGEADDAADFTDHLNGGIVLNAIVGSEVDFIIAYKLEGQMVEPDIIGLVAQFQVF